MYWQDIRITLSKHVQSILAIMLYEASPYHKMFLHPLLGVSEACCFASGMIFLNEVSYVLASGMIFPCVNLSLITGHSELYSTDMVYFFFLTSLWSIWVYNHFIDSAILHFRSTPRCALQTKTVPAINERWCQTTP